MGGQSHPQSHRKAGAVAGATSRTLAALALAALALATLALDSCAKAPVADAAAPADTAQVAPARTPIVAPILKPAPASLKLYALDCGRIEMLDLGIFDQGGAFNGRQFSAVNSCFLVRHPDGDLLWDAGLPDALRDQPEGVTAGAFKLTVATPLVGQLQALGVAPVDVEFFGISHSHFDHLGNGGAFSLSTFLVSEAERAHMFRAEARADADTFAAYAALEKAATVTFTDDYDVFGDGSVIILKTPGHTPGHSSLRVALPKSGVVLLTGDLYHLNEARAKRTMPTFNTDAEETLRSMDRFEKLASEQKARVVIQHDGADVGKLPKPPAFLD